MNLVTQNIDLAVGTLEGKRAEIRKYFLDTYELYERLFDVLQSKEFLYEQPQNVRHPLIFYFGHTATFFMNKLILAKSVTKRVNPHFESIFAIGVDEMSWDDLNDKHYDWPSIEKVQEYRDEVKETILELIDSADITLPITWDSVWWTIMMGIEHERIHLETSSVLLRQMPLEKVKSLDLFPLCPAQGKAPPNTLMPVPSGTVKLGKGHEHELYGWDNEYGQEQYDVAEFKVSTFLVSNEEYLEFIKSGGYHTDAYWSEEGLAWKKYYSSEMPEFWRKSGNIYLLRTMTEEIPLPGSWPAEVCYLEAKAFCRWKSELLGGEIRLPDEPEYHRLRDFVEITEEHYKRPIKANWNLEQYASSTPVDANMHNGFGDVVGNVWQWNETPFHGFDGFKVHPLYDDFSVPTFDNKHNIIKGGSWISTGNEIALHSRYAFRRHFYQHAGFRYVESERKVVEEHDIYETDDLISQYCEFHYGDESLGVPNFSKALATIGLEATKGCSRGKALDIGCSVGRAAFELGDFFKEVDAFDFSTRFVQIGARMQESGSILYERKEEGELVSLQKRSLEELGLKGAYSHINFLQQDATNMKEIYRGYDLVIAANLIDRLRTPARFLEDIATRINKDGVLLIASPYTWLEDFTPKENWLGGFKKDGEPVTTLQGLHTFLDTNFIMIGQPQSVPFIIRETKHKFQHSFSEVTLWKKR